MRGFPRFNTYLAALQQIFSPFEKEYGYAELQSAIKEAYSQQCGPIGMNCAIEILTHLKTMQIVEQKNGKKYTLNPVCIQTGTVPEEMNPTGVPLAGVEPELPF